MFKGLTYMCWPSKQNMVCIQESFNCSVAVIIGEQCSDAFPLYQDYFYHHLSFKKVLLHNKWHYFIFIQKLYRLPDTQIISFSRHSNYIVCQTLKSHHNI